jgi:hypothetical protein
MPASIKSCPLITAIIVFSAFAVLLVQLLFFTPPGRRALPEIYLTARIPWSWRYATPVVTGGIRPGPSSSSRRRDVAGQFTELRTPFGTRDDLNIRPACRKPGRPLFPCSPAGIRRIIPSPYSEDMHALQRRRGWTKPDGPARARERMPRRSRTCQTIQLWRL